MDDEESFLQALFRLAWVVSLLSIFVASATLIVGDIDIWRISIIIFSLLLLSSFSWNFEWMIIAASVGHLVLCIWWLTLSSLGLISVIPVFLRLGAIAPILRRKEALRRRQKQQNNSTSVVQEDVITEIFARTPHMGRAARLAKTKHLVVEVS